MPADVVSMMYAGETPWHGIGTRVPSEVISSDAIRLSGLDWEVEVAPIQTADQKRTAVDEHRVTRRVGDQAILGVVKRRFRPIQNKDAFAMFDNVVGGPDKAVYHTAGSLQGGSKVFIVAKLPEPLVVGKDQGADDAVDRYLLLSNAHDGSRPLQMLFTPVRVVCSNTLAIALSGGQKDEKLSMAPRVTVRHTIKAAEAIKTAERTMARALKYYEKFGEFANYLNTVRVSTRQVENTIAAVFPANDQMIVTKTQQHHRDETERLFTEGKGHSKIAGTAWALLNAFAEYADHGYALRGAKEAEDRSHSILMGGAKGIKARANKTIYGMVRVAA